jgi:hypothetical protein
MNSLSLRFEPDPEDSVGQLFLHVGTASFKGAGFHWVQPDDLVPFATALATYPISADQPAILRLGYDDCRGDDLILGVHIAPAHGRGHLRVKVEVADLYERDDRLRVSFVTNYSEVDLFRSSLEQISKSGHGKATLLAR